MPIFAAEGDLLPQWIVIATALVSGPVAIFARWAWRVWRASRADAVKATETDREEDREDRAAREQSRRDDEDRAIRQWRELYRQENKRRAEELEEHKRSLAGVYEASRSEVHAIRADLQMEVNRRATCEQRLSRLEGVAQAKGWELPDLPAEPEG